MALIEGPRSAIAAGGADFSIERQPVEIDERGGMPPAIRALDDVQDLAARIRASDIHLEPERAGGRARLRVDGILQQHRAFPEQLFGQIVSRVKLLAGMDIADKRQPQDGRFTMSAAGRSIDARVSSMPTIAGEKLVIRMLDMQSEVPTLESLGLAASVVSAYRAALHAPHGFVVVCGPTGSGKTTTLYASLAERNVESQHVCTVEDPVEIRMAGIAQVQVNARAGLTFAAALRAFLRQDPNVLMVGEMRDPETAAIAMSAALSGQLVVTSLHASDAPRAVERLSELGLERRALAAGLSGILAQRLVRTLCAQCKLPQSNGFYGPIGCDVCDGIGYRGRTALCEYVPITPDVREAIASGTSSNRIAGMASDAGYVPMERLGVAYAREGRTSLAELRRVLDVGSL